MIKRETLLKTFRERLDAFAAVSGCGCVWKMSKYLLPDPDLPNRYGQHLCGFCLAVKAAEGGEARCIRHDTRVIAGELAGRKTPFIFPCHAGVHEVIVPLPGGAAELAGVLLLGPFRVAGTECPELELRELWEHLPELRENALRGFAEFVPELFGGIVEKIYADTAGILPERPRDRRIFDVLEYLRGEYSGQTIAGAAERVFMSPSRLSHLFKQECGIGIGDYLRKLRLHRARRFLLSTDWPIGRVGESCGFPDQSHFTLMFRREFGAPPRSYRKKYGRPSTA